VPGKTIIGTYTQSGAPYSATLLDSQQAGVVMNVVDFCTGQLFDWFLTADKAAPLIERLPSNVIGNVNNPNCPNATYVGPTRCTPSSSRRSPSGPARTGWRSRSRGRGELIGDQIDNLSLGHGLFSVLDAFPFQHPDAPELSVSIDPAQRIFGQGAIGTWDDFVVTTKGSG